MENKLEKEFGAVPNILGNSQYLINNSDVS